MKEKDLEYYMSLDYPFIVKKAEDGSYFIKYPDLPGCMTCAPTLEEVYEMGEDAKRAWIDVALQDGEKIPEPRNLEDYSGEFRLRMPKTLHKDLAETAKTEKISMNQYCIYLLAKEHQKELDAR